MRTVVLTIEDEIDDDLDVVCAERGRGKEGLIADIVRGYVRAERLRRALGSPELVALYSELADEDAALAEQGMADFARTLLEADEHEPR